MSEIIWKKINNYENYSVSNRGIIKNNTTNRILKHYIRNGYPSISLCKNNKKKTFNIHTIVASHFLERLDGKFVVNHKNEDKTDNRLENLEYITYGENTKYSASSNRTINTSLFDLTNFRDIPNYTNYMISKNAEIYSKKLKRICCLTTLPNGYHKIKLKGDNDIYKDLYIHVLVAMTYLHYVPSTNQFVINHIDGIKGNNNLNNLEIVTQKQNMKHSVQLNRESIFRRSVYYLDEDNKQIRFNSAKDASIQTGIDNSSILKSCKSDFRLAGKRRWYFVK
jgi:hypothetical protein